MKTIKVQLEYNSTKFEVMNLIVAGIMNTLPTTKLDSGTDKTKKFYKILSDLSNSIDGLKVNEDCTALEAIACNQSALKLPKRFKRFAKKTSKLLGDSIEIKVSGTGDVLNYLYDNVVSNHVSVVESEEA